MKEILQNPKKYGFDIEPEKLYHPIETKDIIVKKEIKDLVKFAEENGINYKTLRNFNPWLRDIYLPNNSGKTYVIKIPMD